MVIQCSSCDTRFKIADDKLKAGGVKVRCSKCKEVFTVQPPEEEQVVATATLSVEETSAPEPSSGDWSDMNATFTDESSPAAGEEAGSGLTLSSSRYCVSSSPLKPDCNEMAISSLVTPALNARC